MRPMNRKPGALINLRPTALLVGLIGSVVAALYGGEADALKRPSAKDLLALPPSAQTKVDFVRDIQPILAAKCYACHGPDKQEKGLRWDVKAVALKGGESGRAIVPGKSAESRVIHLVAGLEKNVVMPKKVERLTVQQIGLL